MKELGTGDSIRLTPHLFWPSKFHTCLVIHHCCVLSESDMYVHSIK